MSRRLRIAVADDDVEIRDYFQECLSRLGHEVVGTAQNGRELLQLARKVRPELVVADIKMPDMDGIDAAAVLNQELPVPMILISAHDDAELLARAEASPVMAYLIKPIKPAQLEAAITLAMRRFDQLQSATQEAATLRRTLDERKVLDRAKGVVMKRLALDEPEAYRRMRRMASDHNRKLIDVAQLVLNGDEVFRQLEGA